MYPAAVDVERWWREDPVAQSIISCSKVSKEAKEDQAWGPGGLISGQRYAYQVYTCTSTRPKEKQPCTGAASGSGWLLVMPHTIGEWHCERRFAELPP